MLGWWRSGCHARRIRGIQQKVRTGTYHAHNGVAQGTQCNQPGRTRPHSGACDESRNDEYPPKPGVHGALKFKRMRTSGSSLQHTLHRRQSLDSRLTLLESRDRFRICFEQRLPGRMTVRSSEPLVFLSAARRAATHPVELQTIGLRLDRVI